MDCLASDKRAIMWLQAGLLPQSHDALEPIFGDPILSVQDACGISWKNATVRRHLSRSCSSAVKIMFFSAAYALRWLMRCEQHQHFLLRIEPESSSEGTC
jgi:hypothetical protein